MKELAGKTAIITGAASGIGLALAHKFAREGAAIALIGVAIHRIDGGPPGSDLGFGRIDLVILSVLAVVIFLANLVELTHWRYSFIGDEGAFFNRAKLILDGAEYSLFDLVGVYGMHPILDSAYLACFLKVFGANIISWRIAEIAVLVSCSSLAYALVFVLFVVVFTRLNNSEKEAREAAEALLLVRDHGHDRVLGRSLRPGLSRRQPSRQHGE